MIFRKKLLLRILCVFLLHWNSSAQESDSLKLKSKLELRNLALKHIRSNSELAITYANGLNKKAKIDKDIKNECLSLNILGKSERVLGNIDKALVYQLSAEKLLLTLEDPELEVTVFNSIANTYSDLGEFDQVLPNYFKALDIAKRNEMDNLVFGINLNLAYFKNLLGENQEALEILIKNRDVLNDINGDNVESVSRNIRNDMMFSKIYLDIGKLDSTIYHVDHGIDNSREINDVFSLQGLYDYKGLAYLNKGNFSEAFKALNKADSLGIILGNEITLMSTRYHLALAHFKQNNDKRVIEILNEVIKRTEENKLNYPENVEIYTIIAQAYKNVGDYKSANYNFEKYIEKFSFQKQNLQSIDNDFKSKNISSFKKELEMLIDEKKKQQRKLKFIVGGSALLFISLLWVLFRFYQNKQRNTKKFEALMNSSNISSFSDSNLVTTKEKAVDTSSEGVNDVLRAQILTDLLKLEKEEYFLKSECSSYNMAKKIKTNTSYLSKVINAHYQKNFNAYINDLRINYAINRLKGDVIFRSYAIQSIAEEIGYKSADSFVKYFKIHTGLNPSFYIKKLNNLG